MRKLIVVFAVTSLLSLSAFAFPGPDSIGFYASQTEGGTSIDTVAPFSEVQVFLMLTNPSVDGCSGWELMVEIEGPRVAESWSLANEGLNVYDPAATGLFNVGIGIGADAIRTDENGAALLATFSAYISDPADEVTFKINGFPGSVTSTTGYPLYVDPDDIGTVHDMGPNTGGVFATKTVVVGAATMESEVFCGEVCFAINSDTTITPNTDTTWSGVKALYK